MCPPGLRHRHWLQGHRLPSGPEAHSHMLRGSVLMVLKQGSCLLHNGTNLTAGQRHAAICRTGKGVAAIRVGSNAGHPADGRRAMKNPRRAPPDVCSHASSHPHWARPHRLRLQPLLQRTAQLRPGCLLPPGSHQELLGAARRPLGARQRDTHWQHQTCLLLPVPGPAVSPSCPVTERS